MWVVINCEMRNGFRLLAWVLVVGYAAFILYVTVFGRAEAEEVKYNFMPFWSYIATMRGEGVNLMRVNYLNVAMFVPLGVLMWCEMGKREWWKVLLMFVLFSVSIEVLQLVLKRGFCEFDDVFHNAIGGMIGYCLCGLVVKIRFMLRRENG